MTATEKPAITAIAPWFGGKRTMAPIIVQELGQHSAYWEPFCGGMSVLFAKEPSAQETVNDVHGDLINLAMVIASERYAELYERLERTLYNEALFAEARDVFVRSRIRPPAAPDHVTGEHVDRAYLYMVVSWMGRNGVAGTKRINHSLAVRWTRGGGQGATRWRNATGSIPAWHERLRNVVILRRDGLGLLERIEDDSQTAVYVDPPYLAETRGDGGGSRYEHEFPANGHNRLAELLSGFRKARIVVSYYDHPSIRRLYAGPRWTIRQLYRQKNLSVQNRRGESRTVAPEVLILNGPSCARQDDGQGELF